MRILLTSSASHVPPRGGSTRSNLAWLEALAAGGHACRVVGGALSTDTPERLAQVLYREPHAFRSLPLVHSIVVLEHCREVLERDPLALRTHEARLLR